MIASVGPWYPSTHIGGSFVGFSAPGIRAVIAFTGLTMLYSTAVELDYADFLKGMVPVLNVSAICGSIAFIGSLASLAVPLDEGWGLYLAFVGSLFALFATFQAWKETQS